MENFSNSINSNENQSSQSTRKNSFISYGTNKKEMNIIGNKISNKLNKYNRKFLSYSNFIINKEENERYNYEYELSKNNSYNNNKKILDADLIIKNISDNTISTEFENNNIFVSFNPNELDEKEKEILKNYIKKNDNLDIKKIFKDLYDKEKMINSIENKNINNSNELIIKYNKEKEILKNYIKKNDNLDIKKIFKDLYDKEKMINSLENKNLNNSNELIIKYNKEKENNLSLNKLLEKKENDIKLLNERNKRLFKEKNYLIEQLIKLTYENKLLKLKNEKKKNNLNKNINNIKEDLLNFQKI